MNRPVLAMLAALVAASTMNMPQLRASGGSCLPRTLTPAEQQAGERVAARLRPLLPPAPDGWRVDGADATDIASGSCLDAATHKSVPQPVSVQVRRSFVREAAPPATRTVVAPAVPPAATDPRNEARMKELEQQIRVLQIKERTATESYQAARRAGDSDGQRKATAELREIRLAMKPPRQELMDLQTAERLQREAVNRAHTEAAFARNRESLANRRIAHVSLTTNSGRALARASKTIAVPGVALAIRQAGLSTNLLFGEGWTHQSHEAYRAWTPSAPTSRVQDVNARIEGPEDMMDALIGELDLKALQAIIER
jgi:hypothetical protein